MHKVFLSDERKTSIALQYVWKRGTGQPEPLHSELHQHQGGDQPRGTFSVRLAFVLQSIVAPCFFYKKITNQVFKKRKRKFHFIQRLK